MTAKLINEALENLDIPKEDKEYLKKNVNKIAVEVLENLDIPKEDKEYLKKNINKITVKFIFKMKKLKGIKDYSTTQIIMEEMQETVKKNKYIVNNILKEIFKETLDNRKWNDLYYKVYKNKK